MISCRWLGVHTFLLHRSSSSSSVEDFDALIVRHMPMIAIHLVVGTPYFENAPVSILSCKQVIQVTAQKVWLEIGSRARIRALWV